MHLKGKTSDSMTSPFHANASLQKREAMTGYAMVIPALLIVSIVAIYPLGSAIVTSFTNSVFAGNQKPRFVGLRNYVGLLAIAVRVLPATARDESSREAPHPSSGDFPRVDRYRLPSSSLTELEKSGVPMPVIDGLRSLERKVFEGRTEFQAAIEQRLGPNRQQYLAVILERAHVTSFRYTKVADLSLFGVHIVFGARDRDFLSAVLNTLFFTVVTVAMEILLGLLLALLINRRFRGRGVMRAAMLLPWAIPTAVSSRMWEWMFGSTRTGFFNVVFQKLGLANGQVPFLQLSSWQLPAMFIIDIWKTTPFMALLILAGLQQIPVELYESCEVDGIGRLRRLLSITLPLLRQAIAVALVFRTLDALRVFDLFQIVLGESKYSMASFTYYELIQSRAAGYSSASGVLIFVVVFVFALLYTRVLGVNAESDLGQ